MKVFYKVGLIISLEKIDKLSLLKKIGGAIALDELYK